MVNFILLKISWHSLGPNFVDNYNWVLRVNPFLLTNTFISPKTAERQTERQTEKAFYICKLQANYNTQRTNDHKN